MTSIVGVGEDDRHSADVPDQDGDLFRTPNPAPDRLHPRIPAKKAKRLLGIETPPSQTLVPLIFSVF
ncbi:unnamed protein product [Anisakis simplex]|uniref:Uncharacterized protein n=1 Tax=Anisakis simplex TaxID=6269 RepID=A0A0M3JIM3_ANISI|nr:unnamed protein product [Anisakis simplex]